MEDMQELHKELIKERNQINEKLRSITVQKRRPEHDVLIVKRPGKDVEEYPQGNKKRSRSPRKVEYQIEKPPLQEDPNSERIRNKKMLNSVLNHLKKAKDGIRNAGDLIETKQRIDTKISQEIKKAEEELKSKTREEIAVKDNIENQRS